MAIIRNERARRHEPETTGTVEVEEEEIDYSWHPTEDEYVSPLTADQWVELLTDPAFMDSDAANAVRCLREYGAPATFQQLSIRYRGTMGRYRRWLSEAAQTAGERFGAPAPQKNQYGMDEWWPLLYQVRTAGKIGAGIFEMMLRPEVEEAFVTIEEQERLARQAENARNLQRIEQLERARQEERQRRAAEQAQAAEAATGVEDASEEPDPEPEPEPAASEPEPAPDPEPEPAAPEEEPAAPVDAKAHEEPVLPALVAFLKLMGAEKRTTGSRYVGATKGEVATMPLDVAAPVDYALRYADRLRYALALMRDAYPTLTAASVARELKDESVASLQSVLNGQEIPSFAYLDRLRDRLFVHVDRLEARDGMEQDLPVFCTLQEMGDADQVADLLCDEPPLEIAYVVDDAQERRTGVVMRFSDLRCVLLVREPVAAQASRDKSPQLDAFMCMVDELDAFARIHGIDRTSRQISQAQWDALASGRVWPGRILV